MTHDEITKQKNEEIKAEPVTDGSLSDADLEQVAGGYGYNFNQDLTNLGTRTGSTHFFRPRR
jgi:hypothetical protein